MEKTTHLHAVDVSIVNGVVTARIIGPVVEQHRGAAIVETVQRVIKDAGDAVRALVLDLGNVTFMNSSGIGAMIIVSKVAGEKGARTIVYRQSAELQQVFRTAKIDKLFDTAETPEDLPK